MWVAATGAIGSIAGACMLARGLDGGEKRIDLGPIRRGRRKHFRDLGCEPGFDAPAWVSRFLSEVVRKDLARPYPNILAGTTALEFPREPKLAVIDE